MKPHPVPRGCRIWVQEGVANAMHARVEISKQGLVFQGRDETI